MIGEIEIAECNFFTVVRRNFNRKNLFFKDGQKLSNVRIRILVFLVLLSLLLFSCGLNHQLLSEVSGLLGLLVLFEVDLLRVGSCRSGPVLSIVLDFL